MTAFLRAMQSKNLVNFDKLPKRQILHLQESVEPIAGPEMKVEDEEIINLETNRAISEKDEEYTEPNEEL